MGNCQGSSGPIDKNIESEDTQTNKKHQKVQNFQALRSYNAEIDPLAQVQQFSTNHIMKIKQAKVKAGRQFQTLNDQKRGVEQDYESTSKETISKTFGQMNAQHQQFYNDFIQYSQNQYEEWTDQNFPAVINSLSQWPETYQRAYQYQWMRPRQIDGLGEDCRIFDGGIIPNDIKQGALGDCYLLSSLAALAENADQHLISRLFEFKNKPDNRMYGVWLCIFGEWQLVPVDDLFPCNSYEQPAYSKANGKELWVLLIEKAYAKVYGSYKKIEAGLTGNAIRDLTGAPYFYINNEDVEATWALLEEHDNNQNILTAGSQADTRGTEIKQNTGIVSGHAYSILDHKVVTSSSGELCRIIQLRNPWGSHEWNGRFSDKSPEWTQEARELCDVRDEDDGIFWMPLEDYCQAYAETTINFLHRHHMYASKRIESQGHKQFLIDFTVDEANNNNTVGHISISQMPDRFFENSEGYTDYSYSMVRLIVMKKTDSGYLYVQDLFKSDRDVDIHAKFGPGEYIALVEVDWCQNNFTQDFVISAYTDSRTTFEQVTRLDNDEFNSYVDSAIRGLTNFTGKQIYNFNNNAELKRIRGTMAGYIYFYYVNETHNMVVQEIGNMSNINNLEICSPYTNDSEFDVDLKPAETIVVKYRINEAGWGAYSYGMKYRHGVGQTAGMGC